MVHSTLSGAAESAAPVAALPSSSTLTTGVQETPASPSGDIQLSTPNDGTAPTVVTATVVPFQPAIPPAVLPKSIGLSDRQRIAMQALAAGNGVEDAAQMAGVCERTLFRWRKHHPEFIAAWNAWQAEVQTTARDLMVVANGHAARTVLHAVQKGDVRTSLAILKSMGILAPTEVGPDIARAVKIELAQQAEQTKRTIKSETSTERKERFQRIAKEKETRADAEKSRLWYERYFQIPPLPRPITPEAVADAVKQTTGLSLRPDGCSITITDITPSSRGELNKLVKRYDDFGCENTAFPQLLTRLIFAHAAEETAKGFEALGATVELRPGWSD